MNKKSFITISSILILLAINNVNANPNENNPWSFSTELGYHYGTGKGYVQTPQGGNINTTSFKRPTFEELGIHHDDFYDILLTAKYNTWGMFVGYRYLSPAGSGTTEGFLITHNQSIPDNTPITGNIRHKWLQFGVNKTFHYDNWQFTPELAGNYIQHRYQFSAPFNGSIRAFGLMSLSVGLTTEYNFTQDFSAQIIAKGTIPAFNLKHYEGALRLNYKILENKSLSITPFIGIGALFIDGEDSQTMPNHIRYENIPYGTFGVKIDFPS